MSPALHDRTVAYVIAAQPVFEDLRQVAAQLAGLLLLAATGSKESSPDHPMLTASDLVLAKAADDAKHVAVPADNNTRLHHHDLFEATAALEQAMKSAHAWPIDVDAVQRPLRIAYAHLQTASTLLPGFQMVSFEQSCCGASGHHEGTREHEGTNR